MDLDPIERCSMVKGLNEKKERENENENENEKKLKRESKVVGNAAGVAVKMRLMEVYVVENEL